MSVSWGELFDVGGEPTAKDAPIDEQQGFFARLRGNLRSSREALAGELRSSFVGSLDDETWERLEETLILADVGAKTTASIVMKLEQAFDSGQIDNGEGLASALRDEVQAILGAETAKVDISHRPSAILVVGVNGTGKTTTVGKLAWHLSRELDRSVLIAAADTYRAAADEQLAIWAQRAECQLVRGQPGSDPASVAFDAYRAAEARGIDVVIVDTAGRLHTEVNLMEELAKIRRVLAGQCAGAPHETLLTVDATTGQNGLNQAKQFLDAVEVSGVCLTKLDGSAKGGIALAIAGELGIPIRLIGIGESLEDLRPFDAREFADALLSF